MRDRCFAKIMKDDPKMDLIIALAWAVSAKKSLPMHGGYSSFQLVFGKNPKLPNIMTDKLLTLRGTPTNTSVVKHINALNAGRKAFNEAMCDEKVKVALRNRARTIEYMTLEKACITKGTVTKEHGEVPQQY